MRVQYPVVECLSRDIRVAGLSLTGGTAYCPGAKKRRRQRSGINTISTAHDPGHGMVMEGDKKRKHHIQGSQAVSPFPTGDHKAARNCHDRQDTLNPA